MLGIFIITLSIGFLGAYIGDKLKIPAGVMACSMLLVACFNIFYGGFAYKELKYVVQICSGVVVGSRITKGTLIQLSKIIFPTVVIIGFMLLMNYITAKTMTTFTTLDVMTALFSSAPGGMTDLTILSVDFGANGALVAILHIVRQLFIVLIVPTTVKLVGKKSQNKKEKEAYKQEKVKVNYLDLMMAMTIAMIFAIIFNLLHINAGIMIGAMFGSALFNIFRHPFAVPKPLTFTTKALAGTFTGLKITKDIIMTLPTLILPIIIIVVSLFVILFVGSYIVSKITKLEPVTAMLVCSPGGLSDMVLLSEELGGDSPVVACVQTARMFLVVMLVPIISTLL